MCNFLTQSFYELSTIDLHLGPKFGCTNWGFECEKTLLRKFLPFFTAYPGSSNAIRCL